MTDELLDSGFESHLRSLLAAQAPTEAPPSLRSFVGAVSYREKGARVFRPHLMGFATLASAVVIVVVALGAFLLISPKSSVGPVTGPTQSASPSAAPVAAQTLRPGQADLVFGLAPGSPAPSAGGIAAIESAINKRLSVYQTATFLGVKGDGAATTFNVHVSAPPTDPGLFDRITATLTVRGNIELVPLETDAQPGQTLAPAASPLVTSTDIESGGLQSSSDNSQTEVMIAFSPGATETLATWSEAHVGSVLGIVVDGTIEMASFVESPITSGQLVVTMGEPDAQYAEQLEALLLSGPMPYKLTLVSATQAPPGS